MEIYAICKTLTAGTDFDKQVIKENNIKIGDKILLRDACVDKWYTKIYLTGYKGSFNSVFFTFEDENGKYYDIYSDNRFRCY